MNTTNRLTVPVAPVRTGELCSRLLRMVGRQIEALEQEYGEGAYSEAHVKALQLLTKTLQAADELAQKQEKANDGADARPGDILEFRKELARHIEALGASGEDEAIS